MKNSDIQTNTALVKGEAKNKNKNVPEVVVYYDEDGVKKFKVKRLTVRSKPLYLFFKRTGDIVGALILLMICALPMVVFSVIIKCDSQGPIFYRQERLGKNGKKFTLIKFRSMRVNAERYGVTWTVENDSRVTKFGAIMRKWRIDELPQLFNILKGDMSFVGPRPERAAFYRIFAERIDGFSERLKVKPGLTGLAQINGGYNLKPEEKIVYDVRYIEHRSGFQDFKIFMKTIPVLFSHRGAR